MARRLIGITGGYRRRKTQRADEFYLLADYFDSVELAGGTPVLIPQVGADETLRDLLGRLDGLVITGGPDTPPARYGQPPHPMTQAGALPARRVRLPLPGDRARPGAADPGHLLRRAVAEHFHGRHADPGHPFTEAFGRPARPGRAAAASPGADRAGDEAGAVSRRDGSRGGFLAPPGGGPSRARTARFSAEPRRDYRGNRDGGRPPHPRRPVAPRGIGRETPGAPEAVSGGRRESDRKREASRRRSTEPG